MQQSVAVPKQRGEDMEFHELTIFWEVNVMGVHATFFDKYNGEMLSAEEIKQRLNAGQHLQARPFTQRQLIELLREAGVDEYYVRTGEDCADPLKYVPPVVTQYNEGVSVAETMRQNPGLVHPDGATGARSDDAFLKAFVPLAETTRSLLQLQLHTILCELEDHVKESPEADKLVQRIIEMSATAQSILLTPGHLMKAKLFPAKKPQEGTKANATLLGPRDENLELMARKAEEERSLSRYYSTSSAKKSGLQGTYTDAKYNPLAQEKRKAWVETQKKKRAAAAAQKRKQKASKPSASDSHDTAPPAPKPSVKGKEKVTPSPKKPYGGKKPFPKNGKGTKK